MTSPVSDENEALEIARNEIMAFPEIEKKVFSFNRDDTIHEVILKKLSDTGKTLAMAESCTGGLISKMFTDIPGSSKAFLGSLVTYSNILKTEILGVKESILETWRCQL